ncbi:MAG: helix-turn-helix domain-containing protein [Planctomycetes bacterium]|nr:helix-turn-helix domain-containing protein [Planctomycetota bacterium]
MSSAMDDRHDLARRARAATGLNQRAFARLLGVNATSVNAWERGNRNPARRTRVLLRLICALPERCMEVLLGEEEVTGGGGAQVAEEGEHESAPDASGTDVRTRIQAAARQLGGGREVVSLDDLRLAHELKGLPRVELDRRLLALEAGGELSLTPALFPALLREEERRAAVDDPAAGRSSSWSWPRHRTRRRDPRRRPRPTRRAARGRADSSPAPHRRSARGPLCRRLDAGCVVARREVV